MPRTRRAAKDTAADAWPSSSSLSSSPSASASVSDSEVSDSNIGATPPPTRARRAGVQTPAGSPAANTRRSSRLSAQSERSPAPKPKPPGRLTRGLRGGSKTAGTQAPRGRPATRAAGMQGRRRAISSPTSDEASAAKRARGPSKRGRSSSGSSDDSDDEQDGESSDSDEEEVEEEEHEQVDGAENGSQTDGDSDSSSNSGSSESLQNNAGNASGDEQAAKRHARMSRGNTSPRRPGPSDSEDSAADGGRSEAGEKREKGRDGGDDSERSESEDAASDAEARDDQRQGSEAKKKQGGAAAKPARAGQSSRGGRGRGRGGRGPGRPRANPQPLPQPLPPPPQQRQQEPSQPGISDDDDDNDDSMGGEEVVEDDNMSLDGFSDIGGEDSVAAVATNLTRRQRAKLTQDYDEELIELPQEAKRSKFSAEEAALRKSEHARRRKFQSLQRAEQLKNDTINRLLNKQTSKGRNKVAEDADTRSASAEVAEAAPGTIRYIQRCIPSNQQQKPGRTEYSLSLARDVGIEKILPAMTQKDSQPSYPPPASTCSMAGCSQTKKYSVASLAACSLDHWRILSADNAKAKGAK
ncbi:INO80 complex subunit B [Coemansia sp. RSA 2599]|nr:INO80 complex subunit B [Coemansia sp. RSA 2599]